MSRQEVGLFDADTFSVLLRPTEGLVDAAKEHRGNR